MTETPGVMKGPLMQTDKFLSGASKSLKRIRSILQFDHFLFGTNENNKSHADLPLSSTGKKNTCMD